MSGPDDLTPIIEELALLVAELRSFGAAGPHFRIIHRFQQKPRTICAPGEEIAAIYLVHRGREYWLRLPLALRILFDYLARHSRLPQSAAQIEAGIRAGTFYRKHASAAAPHRSLTRNIPRSCVRVYIERLRIALQRAFDEASLLILPQRVIVAEHTVMNEVGYRFKASVEWVHKES